MKAIQRPVATDRFGSSRDKTNSFMLVSSGREEASSLWVAKILLMFRIYPRESIRSQE